MLQYMTMQVDGIKQRGLPGKTWLYDVSEDMNSFDLSCEVRNMEKEN